MPLSPSTNFKKTIKPLSRLLFALGLLLSGLLTPQLTAAETAKMSPEAIFDKVVATIQTKFYAPKAIAAGGLKDITKLVPTLRAKLQKDPTQLKVVMDELTSSLATSHTGFLLNDDQEYWAIQSAFSDKLEAFRYISCGVVFERRGGSYYVREVYQGTPAAKSSLHRGDQIVSENFNPIKSCQTQGSVNLSVRQVPGDKPLTITFKPVNASVTELLLRATEKSERIITKDLNDGSKVTKRVGYFRLGAGNNPAFQRALQHAIERFSGKLPGKVKEPATDAMILDLRGGLGGVTSAYIKPFLSAPLPATMPLFVLIDGTTVGGKEILALLLKEQRQAKLVGRPSAGQQMAGQVFDIEPGYAMLYLAVAKPDGVAAQLEGQGVMPDIVVEDPLVFAAGADPILTAALENIAPRLTNKTR